MALQLLPDTRADFHRVSNALQRVLGELELLADEAEGRPVRRRDLTELLDPLVDAIGALEDLRRVSIGEPRWPSGAGGR